MYTILLSDHNVSPMSQVGFVPSLLYQAFQCCYRSGEAILARHTPTQRCRPCNDIFLLRKADGCGERVRVGAI